VNEKHKAFKVFIISGITQHCFIASSSHAPRGNSCCGIGGTYLLSLEKLLRNGQIKA